MRLPLRGVFLSLLIGPALILTALLIGGGDGSAARGDAAGDLDPSFDGDGQVTTDFGDRHDEAAALAFDGDRIVVAGSATLADSRQLALARYRADGSLDPTLDGDGKVLADVSFTARGVAVQADRKILVAGSVGTVGQGSGRAFGLARFHDNGGLDTTFGGGSGTQTLAFAGQQATVAGLALQGDGKIVVAGHVVSDTASGFRAIALARYLPDGTLDAGFGPGLGQAMASSTYDFVVTGVALQSDGKIVVAGYETVRADINLPHSRFAAARFHPDGSLDQSFGTAGFTSTDFNEHRNRAHALAIQPDGKIVLAGLAYSGNGGHFGLVRYNAIGTPDTSFDGTGRTILGTGRTILDLGGWANGVALQADGKIVVAGLTGGTAGYSFGLARVNSDGSPDQSFGSGGTVVTSFGATTISEARAVAIQPDGRPVAVGHVPSSTGVLGDFALARYVPAAITGADLEVKVSGPSAFGKYVIQGHVPLTFIVTVTNHGPWDAQNVTLYGSYLLYGIDRPCIDSNPSNPCRRSALAPGATATYSMTVSSLDLFDIGDFEDKGYTTAVVGAQVISETPDPNLTNNGDQLGVSTLDCDKATSGENQACPLLAMLGNFLCKQRARSPGVEAGAAGSAATADPIPSARGLAQALETTVDLWTFYRLRDNILLGSAAGTRYVDLYNAHGPEISRMIVSDPVLLDQAAETLRVWEPDLEALVEGRGGSTTISAEKVQAARQLLDNLAAAGSPELRQAITEEQVARPLERLTGESVDDAAREMGVNPPSPSRVYLPLTVRGGR